MSIHEPCRTILTLDAKGHLKDLSKSVDAPSLLAAPFLATESVRGVERPPEMVLTPVQPYHTDGPVDIVAMYVLEASATTGGEGLYASVSTIYNQLAMRRPDLLEDLLDDKWPFDA